MQVTCPDQSEHNELMIHGCWQINPNEGESPNLKHLEWTNHSCIVVSFLADAECFTKCYTRCITSLTLYPVLCLSKWNSTVLCFFFACILFFSVVCPNMILTNVFSLLECLKWFDFHHIVWPAHHTVLGAHFNLKSLIIHF